MSSTGDFKERDAMIRWLAMELAKVYIADDGLMASETILEDWTERCIDAARKAAEKQCAREER